MNEIQAYCSSLTEQLAVYYPKLEAQQLSRLLLEEAFGLPYPRLVISNYKVSEKSSMIEGWVKQLLAMVPIQYVLGYAYFHQMKLKVGHGVLIPRKETELLCHILTTKNYLRAGAYTADLCTGSGAIAIYLASQNCRVEAVDISTEALEIARENLKVHDPNNLVTLIEGDILSEEFIPQFKEYDVVVSNPPYVLERERTEMLPHVLEHEPEIALFVPDDDGLRFYKAIFGHYHPYLKVGGLFAFEINPLLSELLKLYFEDAGYLVTLEEDFEERVRFLFAKKMNHE